MIETNTYEIAAAIAQGIVDQSNYLGALATAMVGGMFALRLQFRLAGADAPPIHWPHAFWIGSVFAIPTIALVFAFPV